MASELTEEQIKDFRKKFNKIDKNGDGSISVQELHDVMGDFFTKSEIKTMIAEVDINNDGRVQFEEYLLLARGKKKTKSYTKNQIKDYFKSLDKDGNGKICRTELLKGLQDINPKVEDGLVDKLIEESDKDGDGLINYEEFSEALLLKMPVPK
ncbi:calmodulin-alpha-like [Lytechinus variegatus]|uniref:calmodulin-alpha-like n=1 Tax=Lytechinus variegatus TaxID=7654 RepID=UPI001BB22340|nr:calmodulin-alpha-like [Lytechinus variegatus]XP_041468925.1 calmodulin-alpha-like [Lytechinus variegatus]